MFDQEFREFALLHPSLKGLRLFHAYLEAKEAEAFRVARRDKFELEF